MALRDRVFGEDPRFRRFVLLIAAATALPMIGIPLGRHLHSDATAVLAFVGLLSFFGGPAHVGSTTWFYTDPQVRGYFLANPLRYVLAPVVLIVGTTLAYVVWQEREPTRWINFLFTVWLLWHYQRQNWGVHSFVTRVTSGESASRLEDWILRTAVVGGVIGGIRSANFGAGTPVEAHAQLAFQVGAAVTMSLPLLVAAAIATVPGLRSSPLRLCTLVAGACFFLPVFVFGDPVNAVLTYALAHGLQYLVFMSYVAGAAGAASGAAAVAPGTVAAASGTSVAAGATVSPARPGMGTLVVALLVVGFILKECGDIGLLEKWNLVPLFGLTLGVTMAHFVVDAGIWRLRDEFPRRYVGAAFPFLPQRSR